MHRKEQMEQINVTNTISAMDSTGNSVDIPQYQVIDDGTGIISNNQTIILKDDLILQQTSLQNVINNNQTQLDNINNMLELLPELAKPIEGVQ